MSHVQERDMQASQWLTYIYETGDRWVSPSPHHVCLSLYLGEDLKGTVSRDFVYPVFFIKELILILLEMS